jgi:hypothetical protein
MVSAARKRVMACRKVCAALLASPRSNPTRDLNVFVLVEELSGTGDRERVS